MWSAPGFIASAALLLLVSIVPVTRVMADDAAGDKAAEVDVRTALSLDSYDSSLFYVDFWASWCSPCRASFPWMQALHEELGEQGLTIIAVNTGDSEVDAAKFLEEMSPDFATVVDDDGSLSRQFNVLGMPSSFLLNSDGDIVESHVGFNKKKAQSVRASIKERLADKS